MFDLIPKHDFLVGIDSDGCAFDTMEVKHKECFIPNIINSYGLQGSANTPARRRSSSISIPRAGGSIAFRP